MQAEQQKKLTGTPCSPVRLSSISLHSQLPLNCLKFFEYHKPVFGRRNLAFASNDQASATIPTRTPPPVLLPYEKISHSAPMSHDSLKSGRARVVQMEKSRNLNPQAYHQMLAESPHQITRRSKPAKRSVNSFMAFRCE